MEQTLSASQLRLSASTMALPREEVDKEWQFESGLADDVAEKGWKLSEQQAAAERNSQHRISLLQTGLFLFGWLLGLSGLLKN